MKLLILRKLHSYFYFLIFFASVAGLCEYANSEQILYIFNYFLSLVRLYYIACSLKQ